MNGPGTIPREFVERYETERAGVLRRRLVWYCCIVIAVLGLSLVGGVKQIAGLDPVSEWGRTPVWVEFGADVLMLLIHAAALVYVLAKPHGRARLVGVVSLVVGLTAAVTIVAVPTYTAGGGAVFQRAGGQSTQLWNTGLETLLAVFVLHFLASMLIALSPREGLRALVPVLVLFAVVILGFADGPLWQRGVLVLLSPLAGLPGLAWSWWRHRSFNERFTARAVSRKYDEVSRELSEARRVHEALFPPPVTRGPVHVRYRYEPASEIGGDFLFIRPLAVPPTTGEGALVVVVIDVTGHGVSAALAVNRLHDQLGRMFSESQRPSPGAVISGLNRFVHEALSPLRVYATGVCIECDGMTGAVRYANAGHPALLLRSASGAVVRLDATAAMLGVLEGEVFDAGERVTSVEVGGCIVAYTDGTIEARGGGEAGEVLGIDGVEAIVRVAPVGAISDAVVRAVDEHRRGPADDDALVVEMVRVGG